jgi:UDP-N-acetylmuramyl pentapeptide phosphotransferase/UDP-N-acetylglucosamine-1-phosphate transferase
MFVWVYTIILCLSAFTLSVIGTLGMRSLLRMLDSSSEPGERDNHSQPTPSAGGVAMVISITGFLMVAGLPGNVVLAITILLAVSLWDDMIGLSPLLRLVAHITAAILLLSTLNIPPLVPHVPVFVVKALLVLALVWFMNLYNFMDGIDEITSLETVTIAALVVGLALIEPSLSKGYAYDGLIITSGVLGFWLFNRHPASIFMGDSGSIPLGALTGWLLLSVALAGYWPAVLIVTSYYLIDSGFTLLRRILTGHKPWQAHSEHAYQRFVRAGHSHRKATRHLLLLNLLLLTLATGTLYMPHHMPFFIVAAYVISALIYIYFSSRPPCPPMVPDHPESSQHDQHAPA